ncbi:MAG: type II toxin-antitoxin system RelE/ParE family toxin [Chloroflexi bacterium]|nr:type II toxin-antitoxin system RelE/ParE family toxin [Chloroflexota bacterium]
MEQGEILGDRIQGLQHQVYKVRLPSTDQSKGKSGGYRVIYYVKTKTHIFLITIYAKSQQSDISATVLRQMIEEVENE